MMMTSAQFISVRESSQLLSITEREVMDLIEARKLQAYRIADKFLRLKKSDVLGLRNTEDLPAENVSLPYTGHERIQDFFYYNDFYIFSTLLILGLIYYILFM